MKKTNQNFVISGFVSFFRFFFTDINGESFGVYYAYVKRLHNESTDLEFWEDILSQLKFLPDARHVTEFEVSDEIFNPLLS